MFASGCAGDVARRQASARLPARTPPRTACASLCALPPPSTRPPQLWGRYSKASGTVKLLREGLEVCVPAGGDDSGLFPIAVLDPEAGLAEAQVAYMQPLADHLQVRHGGGRALAAELRAGPRSRRAASHQRTAACPPHSRSRRRRRATLPG